MFEMRVERHRTLYVFCCFTIVGNKFINMDCKISSATKKKKRGPFSSLAINYPRNSILVTFHRFTNGRSDKNLFFKHINIIQTKASLRGTKCFRKVCPHGPLGLSWCSIDYHEPDVEVFSLLICRLKNYLFTL